MPYRFVEGVSIADIAFEAQGKTLEELFISAAQALTNTQVEDLAAIKPKLEMEFTLVAKDEEFLLHSFLQELIFLKDAELLLFKEYDLKVDITSTGYSLHAKAKGDKIDPQMHSLLVDAKAISWHMFKIEKTANGWKAFVIVDV
jgi:SHS2 domain-containing protein